mmetsp:Transcript_38720/g.43203  ORF Transcript_38720/g.43203 Transcript_38720/m.43203 type:complete len:113 (+) Transcript_38720:61-399(+)
MMSFRTTLFYAALLFVSLAMRAKPLYANDLMKSNSNDAIIHGGDISNGSLRGNSVRPHDRILTDFAVLLDKEQQKNDEMEHERLHGTCDCDYRSHGLFFWRRLPYCCSCKKL